MTVELVVDHATGLDGSQVASAPTTATLVYDPNQSPSHLLHRAQQMASDLYAAELGASGLTQRQVAVLSAIAAADGATQTDLVAATGIDRSTLAEMVARMETKGLTLRTKSASDNRANSVSITPTGLAALNEAIPRLADIDKRLLGMLPSSRRDSFMDLLTRLAIPELRGKEPKASDKGDKKKKKKAGKKKKAKKG